MGNAGHPQEKFRKFKKLTDIAGVAQVFPESPPKLPCLLMSGDRAIGANHGGDGADGAPNFAQKVETQYQKHTKIEKFMICSLNKFYIQDFDPRVVTKSRSEPGTSICS